MGSAVTHSASCTGNALVGAATKAGKAVSHCAKRTGQAVSRGTSKTAAAGSHAARETKYRVQDMCQQREEGSHYSSGGVSKHRTITNVSTTETTYSGQGFAGGGGNGRSSTSVTTTTTTLPQGRSTTERVSGQVGGCLAVGAAFSLARGDLSGAVRKGAISGGALALENKKRNDRYASS